MPMDAQTRLLRVLQQGEYTTVGGRTPIKTDVRIVAATNKDLRQLINQGLFREDLFFRLNVVPIRLPPLRERTEDIGDLVRSLLPASASQIEGLPAKRIDAGCARALHAATAGRAMCASWKTSIRRLAALYAPTRRSPRSIIECGAGTSPSTEPHAGCRPQDSGR